MCPLQMNSLDDVISALVPIMTINNNNECGEILYSFESLKQELCHLSNEFIKVGKCFITPNYCYQKKRYELYEYELIITFDNEPFEDFLLKKPGSQILVVFHKRFLIFGENVIFKHHSLHLKLQYRELIII